MVDFFPITNSTIKAFSDLDAQGSHPKGHLKISRGEAQIVYDNSKSSFKEVTKFVQEKLKDKTISNEDKLGLIDSYKHITDRFTDKKTNWFVKFFFKDSQVKKANELIINGLYDLMGEEGQKEFIENLRKKS